MYDVMQDIDFAMEMLWQWQQLRPKTIASCRRVERGIDSWCGYLIDLLRDYDIPYDHPAWELV